MLTNRKGLWMSMLGVALVLPVLGGWAMLAGGTVTGRVLKEDGSAAGGMQVRVMVAPERGQGGGGGAAGRDPKIAPPGGGQRPGGPGGERPKPVAEAVTGDNGTFSVSVPAGKYVIVSGKRGEGMARERITVEEGKTVTVELKLKTGGGGGAGGGRGAPKK